MEGKGCLFKKFAGIDVFDIELNENDPDKLVDIIAALEPTFGGINLEDIKAPECFYIERKLRERLKIPVFHDDQHGTAIIAAAAVLNGLRCVGKDIGEAKLVCSGAGAAAIACLDLLVCLGLRRENTLVADSKGVLHGGREGLDASKARYARDTTARTLADAMPDADIFLGLSGPGALTADMVKTMAPNPIILAMANPTPEIMPEEARAVRPDCIIGTGRSDYPNQVNNVLCFPFIFRGALDVGATTINEEMKLATVRALADLTHAEIPDEVASAYGAEGLRFGPEYLIPKPFDPRLIDRIAPAVAQAAMDSGVATRPITDIEAYRARLRRFVYHSGSTMEPVFAAARKDPKRLIYAEGEEERVLRAAQVVVDEGIARPILIGRPDVIAMRIERFGLRIRLGKDVECVNVLRRPALSRHLERVLPARPPQGRVALARAGRGPDADDADRRRARAQGRRRRDAVRNGRVVPGPPEVRPDRHRTAPGRAHVRGDAAADPAEPPALHLRHARQRRSDRRAGRGDDDARGRRRAALRTRAERGAAVALELRRLRPAVRGEDARRRSS